MTNPAAVPVVELNQLKVSCGNCSLSSLCLPFGLNAEELDRLEEVVSHKPSFQANEVQYHAGDEMQALYAVRSGSFKTVMTTPNGVEQITGFYFPGELMGLDGLGTEKHRCTAIALESSSSCSLKIKDFDNVCCQIPGLRFQLLHLIGEKFSEDQEKLLALGQLKGEERIATFLLSLGQRLKRRGYSATRFNLTMSRHDLANYLGLAVETLSRMLSHLQEEKTILVHRRSVEILDEARIRKLAHHECGPEAS